MEEQDTKSVVNHFEAGANCQVFNGPITGCVFAMPGSTVTQQPVVQQGAEGEKAADGDREEAPTGKEDLVEKLKPIFYNNEGNVSRFLNEIAGMKDKDMTDLVNQWVGDKLISDYGNSRKGDLWTILSEAGLYKSSRQNWCRRVF